MSGKDVQFWHTATMVSSHNLGQEPLHVLIATAYLNKMIIYVSSSSVIYVCIDSVINVIFSDWPMFIMPNCTDSSRGNLPT